MRPLLTVPPTVSRASRTRTSQPASASRLAATRPLCPAPITTASTVSRPPTTAPYLDGESDHDHSARSRAGAGRRPPELEGTFGVRKGFLPVGPHATASPGGRSSQDGFSRPAPGEAVLA